jgi:N6-adenosine-specific RNA methylase IME4
LAPWDGPSFEVCQNVASVCRAFETSRRHEVLSFSHHAEVAGRPAAEQDRLLDWCEETISTKGKPRSTAELRKAVRASIRTEKKLEYNERIEAARPKPLGGKYRIFYVDPPWKYHGLNQADEHGHAEAHYDCLDDQQLTWFRPGAPTEEYHENGKGRLIRDLADDNAVLFLWVTAPLLRRCFSIIEAWGFEYKAVRHEHLLVCTKGQCTIDERKLFDSVQSIRRTEHSKKPIEFYDIIETVYTYGRKLEIFARGGRAGWDSVGNEVYGVLSQAA